LYVHLLEATVDPQLKAPQIPGQDPLVRGIQIQNDEDSVTRVVLNLKSAIDYQISELPGGAGLAIELTSQANRTDVDPNSRATAIDPGPSPAGIAPAEKQSLSAAISNPEMSAPPNVSERQRTPATISSEPAAHLAPVAVAATTTATLPDWSRPSDSKRSDAPKKSDPSAGNATRPVAKKPSVVTLGSLPTVKDLPLPTFVAVSEARGRDPLEQVDFPTATDEVPNATRKAQTATDLSESHSSMASFSDR
jgi:hypothetical protein